MTHRPTVTRVAAYSYAVKCGCGYERFTTGNRARVSARAIASEHRRTATDTQESYAAALCTKVARILGEDN